MWQGVYFSPQTSLHWGGSIHILLCSPSHCSVLTFVQESGLGRDVSVWLLFSCTCPGFRLPPSWWKMDRHIWLFVRLCWRIYAVGRTANWTSSFFGIQACHRGFVSLSKTELWAGKHFLPRGAPFSGELQYLSEQHKVFLEGFQCDCTVKTLAVPGWPSVQPGGLRRIWARAREWCWGRKGRDSNECIQAFGASTKTKKNTPSSNQPGHDGHLLQTQHGTGRSLSL